jgi:transposase
MKGVELYGQVRRAVYVEGLSRREAARRFGIDPRTVAKMLAFSVPPGYRRGRPPARPKLDPFVGIIDRILEEDKGQPAKQQHTSKRIFERLRDEHGYAGGITVVKDYVHERRQRQREMFVPLRHDPGHAQVDFGEALAVIGGAEDPLLRDGSAAQRRLPTSWCRLPLRLTTSCTRSRSTPPWTVLRLTNGVATAQTRLHLAPRADSD